ncbi:MAG TPA: MBL fold metallo-hydrolase, partial [Myxococcota bacterium]|nr:MBL fold metallo-hydrolase [Myxococcota bacterium]
MRVTFVGHACHLVESDGVRVLTDPWLVDPIFGGHVEHDPPLGFGIADLPEVHVLALTHGHLDHFNAPTLARWHDKTLPVVVPRCRLTGLEANLRRLGFHDLHLLDDWQGFERDGVRVVATPSRGVLDECAYVVAGSEGAFFDGADAPQPPDLMDEIAHRTGPVVIGAFSHNSFDQPALLGLESHKPADHAPRAGAEAAARLGVAFAYAGASNLRWTGPRGPEITRKVVRRGPD